MIGRRGEDKGLAKRRAALLAEIDAEMGMTAPLTGRAALSPAVREAMASTPREAFVAEYDVPFAYVNRPLRLGHGQTISQPFVVALMTDLIEPGADDVVLEIGTGSGYQTAVLAALVRRVYSLEVVAPLAASAAKRLADLGYDNVTVRLGDGYEGWREHAPYDAILVTAAASRIPPALIDQLKPGGRLVAPVGLERLNQDLVVLCKDEDGKVSQRSVLSVAFVPLVPKD